jgi:hypothetical protein
LVDRSPSGTKRTTTCVIWLRTLGNSGGAFQVNESICLGRTASKRMPSPPCSPGGDSRSKSNSQAPPGRKSIQARGAKKEQTPASVVQACQTSSRLAGRMISPVMARSKAVSSGASDATSGRRMGASAARCRSRPGRRSARGCPRRRFHRRGRRPRGPGR